VNCFELKKTGKCHSTPKMAAAGDDDFETTPGYKAPAQVDLETLQNLDKDDEALNRWKAKLLEGAACRR
jgi:hypothetical protein